MVDLEEIILLCKTFIPTSTEKVKKGCLGGSAVECLPLAQGMILGSWDRVLHRALRKEHVSASLSESLMNK